MNKMRPPERDRAFEKLMEGYYGSPPRVVPPAALRWLPTSTDELLNAYYGRPQGRRPPGDPMHHRHHHHHHLDRHHGDADGVEKAKNRAEQMSRSFDDGEILARDVEPPFEEYVVERGMSDDGGDEYVVERFPSSAMADEPRVPLSDSASLRIADPLAERAVDISQARAESRPAVAPSREGVPRRPVLAASMEGESGDGDAATGDFADDDADMAADLTAILTGQSLYDPAKGRVVPRGEAASAAAEKPPAPPVPTENSQAIFDKIAESMRYANTFDLGTVALANRFDDFDRVADAKEKATPAPPPRPARTPPADAVATTQDFLEDIDALRKDALAQAGLADSGGRPQGQGQGQDAFQDVAFDATTGAPLTGEFVASALQYAFASAADIDNYFSTLNAKDFISWFNANAANKGPWAHKTLRANAATAANFKALWSRIPQIFGSPTISLLQFLALMSAMINEVGSFDLGPVAERMGLPGHPGLAYAFDRIPKVKGSYNVDGSNWNALKCFQDIDFIAAHGQKPMGDALRNSTDQRWAGWVFPADAPTDTNPAVSGFIGEADFYKFRGRGLIQTTWRGAYRRLIDFVQNYQGSQAEILTRKKAWSGLSLDKAASTSSNDDWDALFMRTDLEIPCVAIALHSAGAGNYLNLSGDVTVLNGHNPGSIWNVGAKLNGSAYANLFQNRVLALCALLGNG